MRSIDKRIDNLDAYITVIEEQTGINKKKMGKEEEEEFKYNLMKEAWYFHASSWYMRGSNGYDGYGCNDECIDGCPYYKDWAEMTKEEKDKVATY